MSNDLEDHICSQILGPCKCFTLTNQKIIIRDIASLGLDYTPNFTDKSLVNKIKTSHIKQCQYCLTEYKEDQNNIAHCISCGGAKFELKINKHEDT